MRLLAGGDGVGGGDRGRNLIGGDDHGSGGGAKAIPRKERRKEHRREDMSPEFPKTDQ